VDRDGRDKIVGLHHSFYRKVYAYCASRLFSKDLAEDAVSAVFLRLVEQYQDLRGRNESEIRGWLYSTASNVVASYLRDADRRRRILVDLARAKRDPPGDEVLAVDNQLDWPTVYEAIVRLRPQDQTIVILRYFEGLESPAIAKAIGMTRVGVRVRLYRAIRTLRRRLEVTYG
jgi:RNA polymerase sigma-70 factor (ECF subfamily)